AGDVAAGAQIEVALVAGAAQAVALDLGNHGARQVRARLAVGEERAVAIAHEHTRIALRVLERRRGAGGERRQRCDLALGRRGVGAAAAYDALGGDPRLAGDEGETGE